jgi:hypothetical protein
LHYKSLNIAPLSIRDNKNVISFQALMYDPCPTVRATTIQGVCQICKNYWELIPPNIIIGFMQNLINDLAWDGSSADVRVIVLRVS